MKGLPPQVDSEHRPLGYQFPRRRFTADGHNPLEDCEFVLRLLRHLDVVDDQLPLLAVNFEVIQPECRKVHSGEHPEPDRHPIQYLQPGPGVDDRPAVLFDKERIVSVAKNVNVNVRLLG